MKNITKGEKNKGNIITIKEKNCTTFNKITRSAFFNIDINCCNSLFRNTLVQTLFSFKCRDFHRKEFVNW